MKETLDGPRGLPGGIMKFHESSNIDVWKNYEKCKVNRGYLLPHYFDAKSDLMNESLIRNMLGEIMIGIDNLNTWEKVMGLTAERVKLPGRNQTGQVNT